jgi:Ras-related protein Rab-6A
VRSERGSEAIIVIVGNKSDKVEERTVTVEEGTNRAKELDALYVDTSAKTGDNIKTLFRNIAQALPGMENAQIGNSDLVDIKLQSASSQQIPGPDTPGAKKGCCNG